MVAGTMGAAWLVGCNNPQPAAKNDRMDLTVKPGDDFYKYASGQWINNLPEKPEYSRYNQFDILDEINEERIRGIIADIVKNSLKTALSNRKSATSTYYIPTARGSTAKV